MTDEQEAERKYLTMRETMAALNCVRQTVANLVQLAHTPDT
jgi:hypothetical protein